MRTLPIALLCAAAVADGGLARADAHSEAQTHVDRASKFYDAKQYREALDELNTAYTLDPQPPLLYAIGQIHVALGECNEAVVFYNRYLASRPDADGASAAREAIATCKNNPHGNEAGSGAGSAAGSAGTTTNEGSAATSTNGVGEGSGVTAGSASTDQNGAVTASAWYGDHFADAMVIGGTVSLAIGIGLYLNARDQASGAGSAGSYAQAQSQLDHANTVRDVAVVLGGAGIALVGVGVYRYLHRHGERGVMVTPVAGGASVSWTTRF